MIQTRRSLNTIDSIITPSFDRRNIRNIRVNFSSFWFLVERCSMPFLHELTGMWVQAALGCGCSQRHAQMYWLTSYIKMARCQALGPVKICTTLLLHSSKTTAHCCSPRGYQPRAGRHIRIIRIVSMREDLHRTISSAARSRYDRRRRAPVAVFKAGRLRIW
jgi:hypothetical protein